VIPSSPLFSPYPLAAAWSTKAADAFSSTSAIVPDHQFFLLLFSFFDAFPSEHVELTEWLNKNQRRRSKS